MDKKLPTLIVMACVWAGLYALSACSMGENTLADLEPDAVPQDPPFYMVESILDRSCVPCHKGGDDGELENDDPSLDTCAGIIAAAGNLRTVLNDESMPPGAWPRLTEREKLIIERWLDNGACAPCNLGGCP